MKIQTIGSEEDPVFQDIRNIFLKAIHQLQVDATIDEVIRLEEIQQYPVSIYPAVVINEQLICEEHTIILEMAKKCILDNLKKSDKKQ